MSSNSKSLSKKIRSLQQKNAAKKIQRGFRTMKKRKNLELFMQNPRNPLLNFGFAAKASRKNPSGKPTAMSVLMSNLLNDNMSWGRHISSFSDPLTPLHRAQIDLMDIAQTKEFKDEGGTVTVRDDEVTHRIDPKNFGPLVRVEEEDDNDEEDKMRYEFIFKNVEIIVSVDNDSKIASKLNEVYQILEPLVPKRKFSMKRSGTGRR